MTSLDPTEHEFQAMVCEYLTLQARPGLIWFAIPNGGHRHIHVARMMKKEGVKKGIPDMAFLLPEGHCAWLELKTKQGRLSPDQREFRDRARQLGHTWSVARDLDEVMTFLAWIGATRGAAR